MACVEFLAEGLLFPLLCVRGFGVSFVCVFGLEAANFPFVLWITKRSLVWRRTSN